MTYETPMCLNCKHFDFKDETKNSCTAYPARIPDEIIESRVDHRKPYKGDGGIRYSPIDADKPTPFD